MEQIIKLKKHQKTEELNNYAEVLRDVKSILENAKYRAYKAVDNLRVQAYWQIGERIVREELQHKERANYGDRLIEILAKDLGISERNLHNFVKLYNIYPILHTVCAQLSWSHLRVLIYIENKENRQFYEQQTIQNSWSVRELIEQIRSSLYERMQKAGKIVIIPAEKTIQPEKIFKNIYNFDFLNLSGNHSEDELKTALIKNIEKFLQELGSDFFVGKREVPVLIGGQYFKIDLELFHAGLLCYIIVEIKTEPFKPAFAGQMNAYLNWYKQNKWQSGQKQPIGLIICKSKDEETVHYALGDLKKEMFVSEYKTKLPSEGEIRKMLKSKRL